MFFDAIKKLFNDRVRYRHPASRMEQTAFSDKSDVSHDHRARHLSPDAAQDRLSGSGVPADDGAKVFPLALAAMGERVRIATLSAGKGLDRQLMNLGLPVGAEVEVVHRQGHGRMVVARNRARVALAVGMTRKIMVTGVERTPVIVSPVTD